MNRADLKKFILNAAPGAGFLAARIYREGAESMLVCALSFGNTGPSAPQEPPADAVAVAPFARRNYYRAAVRRLKKLAAEIRRMTGTGEKKDGAYRIFCNSRRPEKPLAAASGLGAPGRNGLIITKEAGSLAILAAMNLPFDLEGDRPVPEGERSPFPLCESCGETPPCAAACPTGALRGDGSLVKERCIQWYASGGDIPEARAPDQTPLLPPAVPDQVAARWGRQLYGCTLCQDVCPRNRPSIPAAPVGEGPLPPWLPGAELLSLDDAALKERFRGTALGMSWLGPAVLRRSIRLALGHGPQI